MKYALLIVGEFRTFYKCYESIISSFKDLDYDIFLLINLKGRKNNHKWNQNDLDNIKNKFNNVKFCLTYTQEEIKNTKLFPKIPHKMGRPHFKNHYSQFWGIEKIFSYALNYANENNIKYDIFIRSRPDILIESYNISEKYFENLQNEFFIVRGRVGCDAFFITTPNGAIAISKLLYLWDDEKDTEVNSIIKKKVRRQYKTIDIATETAIGRWLYKNNIETIICELSFKIIR